MPFNTMHLEMSFAKWWPFFLGLNVLYQMFTTHSKYRIPQQIYQCFPLCCLISLLSRPISPMPMKKLGFYSLSGKTCCCQTSLTLEAARFDVIMILSLWYLTGFSVALLPRCLSHIRAIGKGWTRISRLRDFTRSCGKTSLCLVNRSPG